MDNKPTIEITGEGKDVIAKIEADYTERSTMRIGSFVRVQNDCKCYDGVVIAIWQQGFTIGWLDQHNDRQYTSFGWDAIVIVF